MPPRSPLPQRQGLDAAWLRTPDNDPAVHPRWATMREFLLDRLPAEAPVAEMLGTGEFVDQAGRPWTGAEPYRPNAFVWFHRQLVPEPVVPFPIEVLDADERVVVVDKPHFLATTPRGTHVRETVLVRLRDTLGLPDLAAAHRLDRLTAGVLVLTTHRRYRAAYAGVFQTGRALKSYEAIAPYDPTLAFPRRVTSRIEKRRGNLRAEEVAGEPNAETLIELVEVRGDHARYRLTPATGKTHQLRVHLARLGLPILGDPLYPRVLDVEADDFASPLQLIARRLSFADPIDQAPRDYTSRFALRWPGEAG
ncbi:MAG: pseudouridylate synthase [Propionibacteriaceae bacterium]|nr:pseudouridylate synthase [Propionibacteriaceae bacterium]